MVPEPEDTDREVDAAIDAARDGDAPTRADELAEDLREMMQAAEDLPTPEHLLRLLEELSNDHEKPPGAAKSAGGRLRS